MASSVSPTIVNVGYRSTNYWVVSAGRNRLLVDLGWPGRAAESMVAQEDPAVVARSWQLLWDRRMTTVYPGHGAPYYLG